MLFSAWQATTQALQPTQALMSTAMPHARPSYGWGGNIDRPGAGSWPIFCTAWGSFARSARVTARTTCRSAACSCAVASMVQWSCVQAIRAVSPVFTTSSPLAAHGASLVRRAYASKPTPVPTRPARRRPKPRWTVTAPSAWPGSTHSGATTVRPPSRSSATSVWWPLALCSVFTPPRASAVLGLTRATLSHVTLVSGFGSSCSQPRFAKRPSNTEGSVRNAISRPAGAALRPAFSQPPKTTFTVFSGNAVPATTPSCSARFQRCSKPSEPSAPSQWARSTSWPPWSPSAKAARTSISESVL